jgi:hypothetical protein
MLTALAKITKNKINTLLPWFSDTPYIGRRSGQIMNLLSLLGCPLQALLAGIFRLNLAVCERRRSYIRYIMGLSGGGVPDSPSHHVSKRGMLTLQLCQNVDNTSENVTLRCWFRP